MTTPLVVPQSPMGLGDVFGTTFSILKRRFKRLVGISAVQQLVTLLFALPAVLYLVLVLAPMLDVPSFVPTTRYFEVSVIGSGIAGVVGTMAVVVSVYFLGLLIHTSHQAMLHRDPGLTELRALNRGTLRRLGPVYLVAILGYYLLLGVGLVPVFAVFGELLPGMSRGNSSTMSDAVALRFLGAWALAMVTLLVVSVLAGIVLVKAAYLNQVGTVENLGSVAAVKRAFRLTKGSFWRTAGYLIVMNIAVGVVQQAVGMIAELVVLVTSASSLTAGPQAMLASGFLWRFYGVVYVLLMLVQVVCVPFQMAFVTVMYVDQVRRIDQGPLRPPQRPFVPSSPSDDQPVA